MSTKPNALITDFDGTVTERDFYLLIAERYMDSNAMRIWDTYRADSMTHFEAMQAFFSHAPTTERELLELLRDTRPDPEFSSNIRRLADQGWDVIIVSAGSSWYIQRILQASGVQVTVHSNPGQIVPGRGLVMELPRESPFFCADVGIDKSAVVRDALTRYQNVAFAGDGPPDVAPALLVPPKLRFARGFLADELSSRGESFQSFTAWSQVASTLLETP